MKNSNYISIKQYLENRGVSPARDRGYYGMYHSPFREDAGPSFKVDYQKDLWHDFGTGEGGSIVDLMMKLENCSLSEAFKRLDGYFSFHRNDIDVPNPKTIQESTIKIQKIASLAHPVLLDYLMERGIDAAIAQAHCSEVYYSVGDKPYFAVGFKNDAGGYELRNKYFKGSSSPKNITTINNGSDSVMLFEGFIDFLSYLSMKNNPTPRIDSTILNSVSNLSKAIPFLQSHQIVHAFLDNDEAGKRAVDTLRSVCKEVVDQSDFYRNHKDLNDYWQEKSSLKVRVENDSAVQFRQKISTPKRGRGL